MEYLNEAEKKLIAALRSGEYKQTTRRLFDGSKYCCLGVACDISELARWNEKSMLDVTYYEYLREQDYLPERVMEWLNWNNKEGMLTEVLRGIRLAELNDWGFTFNQIADIIEAGLVAKEDGTLNKVKETR
jgi:hypothetical protein